MNRGFIASMFLAALISMGCQQVPGNDAQTRQPTQEETSSAPSIVEGESNMSAEEKAVLESFEAMQQAMIDKDVEAMRALTTQDKTFTHMSGKVQTREEFFAEIADGTLNYFGYTIHNPKVQIEGDRATLTGSTTLDARVYGISGSWTLPTNTHFINVDGAWIQCN